MQELLAKALRLHQDGVFDAAEKHYRDLLDSHPRHANALQLLGTLLLQSGRAADAITYLEQALSIQPDVAEWHANLAEAYKMFGAAEQIDNHYQRALTLKPQLSSVRLARAAWLLQNQRDVEAANEYHHLRPTLGNDSSLLLGLGILAHRRHDFAAARQYFNTLLEKQSAHVEAWHNLANTLAAEQHWAAADAAWQQALSLRPDYGLAWLALGNSKMQQGDAQAAQQAFRQAIASEPQLVEAYVNLAHSHLLMQRDHQTAEQLLDTALNLDPDNVYALANLCATRQVAGRMAAAEEAGRRAVALRPDFAQGWSNLGSALFEQGQHEEALACFQRAIELVPQDVSVGSNLLFCLNYTDRITPEERYQAHLAWARRLNLTEVAPRYRHRPDPGKKRLRLAYLSPDLRQHPVGNYLAPVLAHHDHQRFEVHCYSTSTNSDALSERLRSHADCWHDAGYWSDAQLVQSIVDNEIDILVDLAGHTAGGKLHLLAGKLAPVQISWLGYLATSGLASMDFRITDAIHSPAGSEALHSERLLRLPHFIACYEPPAQAPEPAPPPSLQRAYVTYGSLNNFAKLRDDTLLCWRQLLERQPRARLLLVAKDVDAARQRLLKLYGEALLARVDLRATLDFSSYLALHAEIDIALDSYPYNGFTTTLHALWMGVPTITLSGQGDGEPSRSGESLYTVLQLPELVAKNEADYLALALELSSDPTRLTELRQQLRPRLAASPLVDAAAFTGDLEACLEQAWAATVGCGHQVETAIVA